MSPWEPKTWCNRCRPSCHALASPASLSPNLPPPSPPHCPVRRPTVPVVPNACSQSLTGPWSAWHMGRLTMLLRVDEHFACLCPQIPQREERYDPSTSPCPSSMMLLVLLVKVTAECFLLVKENRPFAVFRLLVAAAWLQCSAEILPPSCSLHNARRSRLAASSCISLSTDTVSGF